MIIKTRLNSGAWKVFSGTDVEYIDRHSKIEVPSDLSLNDVTNEPDTWGLPDDWDELFMEEPLSDLGAPLVLAKWVRWLDADKDIHVLLVTVNEVYVCNDAGQTLEALR